MTALVNEQFFTLGSAVWVVNGFFVFLPYLGVINETNKAAGGWSAFAGGTLFEVGSYLMILEALNRKHQVLQPTISLELLHPPLSQFRGRN